MQLGQNGLRLFHLWRPQSRESNRKRMLERLHRTPQNNAARSSSYRLDLGRSCFAQGSAGVLSISGDRQTRAAMTHPDTIVLDLCEVITERVITIPIL